MRYLLAASLSVFSLIQPAIAQSPPTFLSDFAAFQMNHYKSKTEFTPQLNDARLSEAQAYCQFLSDGGTGGQWSQKIIEQRQSMKEPNGLIALRVWRERIPIIFVADKHFCPEQSARSRMGF